MREFNERRGKMLEIIFWGFNLMSSWWYWVIASALFYFFFAFELAMNGGEMSLKNQLRSFWEEFLWASPVGRKYRGDYIREMVSQTMALDPNVSGFICGYSYEEIVKRSLYEEVGTEVLPGALHFYLRILIASLWPLAIAIWAFLWVSSGLLYLFVGEERLERFADRFFPWNKE